VGKVVTGDYWVERFLKEVLPKLERALSPSLVVLFGSRIKGEATEDSDLDVIVVAEAFSDIPFLKRMPMLLKLVNFAKHIDFLCYTPEEFERLRNSSTIIAQALEEGVVVKGDDGHIWRKEET
jgi:hypothetical protein